MKRILLFCLTALLVLTAQAQQGFRLGLTVQPQASFHLNSDFYKSGGLTLYGPQPNTFGADSIQTRFTPGFGISMRMGYQFNDRHGFETGVMYSWQGQNWKVTTATGTVNRDERFHLFKIPLLYRFNTAKEGKKWQFLLNAGLQVSVLANAGLYIDGDRLDDPEPTVGGLGFRDYFKEASLDGVLGIGTLFKPAERWELTLMARTDVSILDAEDLSYKLKSRGDTRFLTVGLNVGFNYILIPRSKAPAAPNVEVVPATN